MLSMKGASVAGVEQASAFRHSISTSPAASKEGYILRIRPKYSVITQHKHANEALYSPAADSRPASCSERSES